MKVISIIVKKNAGVCQLGFINNFCVTDAGNSSSNAVRSSGETSFRICATCSFPSAWTNCSWSWRLRYWNTSAATCRGKIRRRTASSPGLRSVKISARSGAANPQRISLNCAKSRFSMSSTNSGWSRFPITPVNQPQDRSSGKEKSYRHQPWRSRYWSAKVLFGGFVGAYVATFVDGFRCFLPES